MTDARGDARGVERYEQLRSHALDGEPSGFRLGLALLERRGVAARSRAWGATAPAPAGATPPARVAPGRRPVMSSLVRWRAWRSRASRRGECVNATTIAQKVSAEHLARTAYLYVRQSTLRQVQTNTESAERQYALRQRAVQLGWDSRQIVVIDTDQGQSGASSTGREGFQRLVADVGLGKAGIVLGLEVSRLARNNADWHRLLEICALSRTLICDEDGLYDPADFNDRLLLGLKGTTMSEAELHFIRARLQGDLSKARRGLPMPLPVGLVCDPADRVVLDPDGVQRAIRHLFDTFARTGSARAVVQAFNREGILFPLACASVSARAS